MPFGMTDYIQSVVVQEKVYVGGGDATKDMKIVMEYDITSAKWAELPPYQVRSFGMAVINNQLVLVGGYGGDRDSKVLGVWGADGREWTHPYPEMPTARSKCSVVAYKDWLVVACGVSNGWAASSVEIMHTFTKQWHTGQPTPMSWFGMKTAIVGDICYFMGGYASSSRLLVTDSVYCVSLPALISQAQSQVSRENSHRVWKEIHGLEITLSAPLSVSGSLLAVGGRDIASRNDTTAIHLYQPDTGEWVKVGDLSTPRYSCTCAIMIRDRKILVAGGSTRNHKICTLNLAYITP